MAWILFHGVASFLFQWLLTQFLLCNSCGIFKAFHFSVVQADDFSAYATTPNKKGFMPREADAFDRTAKYIKIYIYMYINIKEHSARADSY